MSGMFWIALELSIPKIGFKIMLSLMVKKVDAFKFDGVAESDNTGAELSCSIQTTVLALFNELSFNCPTVSTWFGTSGQQVLRHLTYWGAAQRFTGIHSKSKVCAPYSNLSWGEAPISKVFWHCPTELTFEVVCTSCTGSREFTSLTDKLAT